jgi:hypothetical protein
VGTATAFQGVEGRKLLAASLSTGIDAHEQAAKVANPNNQEIEIHKDRKVVLVLRGEEGVEVVRLDAICHTSSVEAPSSSLALTQEIPQGLPSRRSF